MATEKPIARLSGIAAADLSAKRNYIAKIDTAGLVALCGDGGAGIGIISEPDEAGQVVAVTLLGEYPVIYGDSVTAGDPVASDASGKAVTAVGGDYVIGIAKETGIVNDIRTIILLPKGPGSFPAGTQGQILYYNGSNWVTLNAGTANQLFKTGGAGANPAWANVAGKMILAFPLALAKIADGDLLTGIVPGFPGTISKFFAVCNDPATTPAKTTALNLEIGTTNVTGGVLTLTSANMTPLGAKVDATAITATNTFTDTDAISIEAASTTGFIEGSVVLYVVITPTLSAL